VAKHLPGLPTEPNVSLDNLVPPLMYERIPAGLPEFGGRTALQSVEDSAEMEGVVKPDLSGNLRDGDAGRGQEGSRDIYAPVPDIGHGRLPEFPSKEVGEVDGTEVGGLGYGLQAQRFAQVIIDEAAGGFYPFVQMAGADHGTGLFSLWRLLIELEYGGHKVQESASHGQLRERALLLKYSNDAFVLFCEPGAFMWGQADPVGQGIAQQ